MTNITRKDFLDATLLGVGAALLAAPSPAEAMRPSEGRAAGTDTFTGPGGVGDYATSNGNTKAVIDAAHTIRDGAYGAAPKATDTGEVFDLVVVGGGITGLTAAYFFAKGTENQKDLPRARQPSDLRRRGEAERVPRERRAAHRAAGLERLRRAAAGRRLAERDVGRSPHAARVHLVAQRGRRDRAAHGAGQLPADGRHRRVRHRHRLLLRRTLVARRAPPSRPGSRTSGRTTWASWR